METNCGRHVWNLPKDLRSPKGVSLSPICHKRSFDRFINSVTRTRGDQGPLVLVINKSRRGHAKARDFDSRL